MATQHTHSQTSQSPLPASGLFGLSKLFHRWCSSATSKATKGERKGRQLPLFKAVSPPQALQEARELRHSPEASHEQTSSKTMWTPRKCVWGKEGDERSSPLTSTIIPLGYAASEPQLLLLVGLPRPKHTGDFSTRGSFISSYLGLTGGCCLRFCL